MDLTQRKLNKSEWNSIEKQLTREQMDILELIVNGDKNVNIKYNKHIALISFLKIEKSLEMEDYLYKKYFSERINKIKLTCKQSDIEKVFDLIICSNPKIKKADIIRLEKNDISKIGDVYESILIEIIENLVKNKIKNNKIWQFYYFTLYKMDKNTILNLNKHVKCIIDAILLTFEDVIDMSVMIKNSVEYIEKNELLLKYADLHLYEHQKEIFTIFQNPNFEYFQSSFKNETVVELEIPKPKLVLYIAPTGTGKTLTPLGLSEQHKIIFVCAARHIGLALAKAAISVNKKVAFAFGCSSADDIRLHYAAAKEYKINRRTGGIGKVDNSVGDKVEIIICDVKSYLFAMYYMMAFNPVHNIITYWDEPTISMDYETHDLHEIIDKNWKENLIPNIVLSSATLPKMYELPETITHFNKRFLGAEIHNITSYDCKKTIPIISKNGYIVMPHLISNNYQEILKIVEHCKENLTILRYLDLNEVVQFIGFIEENNYILQRHKISRKFASLNDINMQNIKLHYIEILGNIIDGVWQSIWIYMSSNKKMYNSVITVNTDANAGTGTGTALKKSVSLNTYSQMNTGKPLTKMLSMQDMDIQKEIHKEVKSEGCAIYISTKDAHTLTDGPTIFLAEDVEKIAKFCIQQANIPKKATDSILEKIEFNNTLNEKIAELEEKLETEEEKSSTKVLETSGGTKFGGKDYSKKGKSDPKKNESNESKEIGKIHNELDILRGMIKSAELNETFVPNKTMHLKKWATAKQIKSSFTSDIDEQIIIEIMLLKDVSDSWKILLLMGIGVFTNHPNITYTEIMKKLADQQKLYLVIASSDYIYGTNYQFCHGYLSKDLILTQEKLMQALGRIGRNNIQQTYSVRLRDNSLIKKLYYTELDKLEVKNMNKLFG
jgi:hypothetical protein